ncbi:HAMP domain-containing protein [Candidatus Woesearchaeota archaeon]|nr:HAMP domain-containing protein [Candidatus Woesearchaeota archaeon]
MRFGIKTKIVLITIAILFFAIGANTAVNSRIFAREYSNTLQLKVFAIGESLKFQLDKLLRLGIPVENLVGFDEQCQDIVSNYEEISYASVIDSDGEILFHNDPSQHGRMITGFAALDAVKNARNTIQVNPLNGENYYDIFIPVFETSGRHAATVRVGFPQGYINQKTRKLFIYSAWVAFISFTLAIILLVSALSTIVTKPLMGLLTIVQGIGKSGSLTTKISLHRDDELGQLASAFNQMLGELKKSQDKLEGYSKNLGKEVKKRTKELNKKVGELSEARTATINILEDVSEASEKLKDLDRMKDEFLSLVSHELKTPMTPMQAYIEMLSDEDLGSLKKEQKDALIVIARNAKRLKLLIEDVLDISRIETRRMKFSFEEIDIKQLIEETVRDRQIFADEKHITLMTNVPKLPITVTDRNRVTQILVNLLDNAIKFSPKDKTISVYANRFDKDMVIKVQDQGIGIKEEDQKRIFDKFFQVDPTTKRRYGGVGLGLAICKGIVELLGGKMGIESHVGKGSTFYFTVPIRNRPPKLPENQ